MRLNYAEQALREQIKAAGGRWDAGRPSAHILLGPDGFTAAANGRSGTMLWADVKEVIEFKDYYLFMLVRIGGVIVPRSNMPAEGDDLIRGVGRTRGILSVGK